MTDHAPVSELVERATAGDQAAWDLIVERFAPLVWAVCRRHRLGGADADDVGATVWLRLVERLNTIREPAALAGWIATTARNECLQLLRSKRKQVPVDAMELPDDEAPLPDSWLLAQERSIALRAAFRGLSDRCRQLLTLLFGEPPVPYVEISAEAGIPIGGIGPTRKRCLDQLRHSPALVSFGEGRGPTVEKQWSS